MVAKKTTKKPYVRPTKRKGRKSKASKKQPRKAPISRKKKSKKVAPKKHAYSKAIKAIEKKERELQRALDELKIKRRLYRKGYTKGEATRQVKQFFKVQLEEAKKHGDIMERALQRAADDLTGYSPDIKVHVNADGTVDGEIVLTPDPVDANVQADFREIVGALPKMRGAWLMPEVYYTPELEDFYDESDFLVRQGLVGIQVHSGLSAPTASQWMKPSGLTKAITMRLLAEKFQDEAGMKPTQYVLRLFWSKDGRRP